MDPSRRSIPAVQNERRPLSRPQVYVQVQWGVSWSQHSPQQHSMTYMSRNLQNSRDLGNFPRQVPPSTTNYLTPAPEASSSKPWVLPPRHPSHYQPRPQKSRPEKQRTSRGRPQERPRENERSQRANAPYWVLPQFEFQEGDDERDGRCQGRRASTTRGLSAPPPLNDSPWDASAHGPCPRIPSVWKDLPPPPSQFRLGTDDMPWDFSAPSAMPADEEEDRVPMPPPRSTERPRRDDNRNYELASLSTAMMTVDNGFEDQWWYQGMRYPTENWRPAEEERRVSMSMSDPALVSAIDPSWASGSDDKASAMRVLVSPISETSGSPAMLQRSLTTRSEELFM